MRAKSWLGLTAAGLAAMFLMTGCTEETPPGGPGAATVIEGEPAEPEATFTLELPTAATNVEQGQSQVVTVGVDRGDAFADEVTIVFEPPQGVTIEPEQITITPEQEEAEVTILVDPTVAVGELLIPVRGEAGSGPPTEGQLAIEVTEREGADTAPAKTPEEAPDVEVEAPENTTPPAESSDIELPPTETLPAEGPPATEEVNPEEGAPEAQDPNAAPADPANPEEGAPAVEEEPVENADLEEAEPQQ